MPGKSRLRKKDASSNATFALSSVALAPRWTISSLSYRTSSFSAQMFFFAVFDLCKSLRSIWPASSRM